MLRLQSHVISQAGFKCLSLQNSLLFYCKIIAVSWQGFFISRILLVGNILILFLLERRYAKGKGDLRGFL